MSKDLNKYSDELYSIPVVASNGKTINLEQYRGRVLLIVNVASRCWFTSQYDELQKLQLQYDKLGFSVLAFPCNQFMWQEPGEMISIKKFCTANFKVTFPIFAKVNVNGRDTCLLYKFLKKNLQQKKIINIIPWNFTKFLIDRDGMVLQRYSPLVDMGVIATDINKII